ncbi:MAG: hypothetical protein LC635_05280 [Pseudonocardiaceae bacterium]|nr:hypothetical protein [Pseudonocardiaceae bacterium]
MDSGKGRRQGRRPFHRSAGEVRAALDDPAAADRCREARTGWAGLRTARRVAQVETALAELR